MKTLGLLGGLSYQATVLFYQRLNESYFNLCGEYPTIVVYSVNMKNYKDLLAQDVAALARDISQVFQRVHSVGASIGVLTALSMHRALPRLDLPAGFDLLDMHAVARASLLDAPVLVLGTKFLMEDPYSLGRIGANQLEVIVPNEQERSEIEGVITSELNRGVVSAVSKRRLVDIIRRYRDRVGQVLIACTSLPLILKQADVDLPLWDIVELTCHEAVRRMTQETDDAGGAK